MSTIIEDLIEIGVDILNPVQVSATGMDPGQLKAQFGDRLCFCGSVCVQTTLAWGTPQDVEREVRRRRELFPRGGLFLGPTHAIQVGSPLENVLALYRTAGSLRETIDDSILSLGTEADTTGKIKLLIVEGVSNHDWHHRLALVKDKGLSDRTERAYLRMLLRARLVAMRSTIDGITRSMTEAERDEFGWQVRMGLPFFSQTACGSRISRFSLHLVQYASIRLFIGKVFARRLTTTIKINVRKLPHRRTYIKTFLMVIGVNIKECHCCHRAIL